MNQNRLIYDLTMGEDARILYDLTMEDDEEEIVDLSRDLTDEEIMEEELALQLQEEEDEHTRMLMEEEMFFQLRDAGYTGNLQEMIIQYRANEWSDWVEAIIVVAIKESESTNAAAA